MEVRVGWGDMDPAAIVFYPNFFAWIDEAAHEMFENMGVPIPKLMENRRLAFGLVEASCRFKSPARYHDVLVITSTIKNVQEKTMTVSHKIRHKDTNVLSVMGMEIRACMDISNPGAMKATAIPDDLREIFRQHMVSGD